MQGYLQQQKTVASEIGCGGTVAGGWRQAAARGAHHHGARETACMCSCAAGSLPRGSAALLEDMHGHDGMPGGALTRPHSP